MEPASVSAMWRSSSAEVAAGRWVLVRLRVFYARVEDETPWKNTIGAGAGADVCVVLPHERFNL